jgi:F0F1-type ATP synthase membrane subunit a
VAELGQRSLWGLALAVLAMNLPFGFWRAGAKRFTRPWFVAVHAPVPLVIFLRVVSGLGWHLVSFPILIGAFFTGQLLGGAMRRR